MKRMIQHTHRSLWRMAAGSLLCTVLATACAIKNDIPYPIVDGSIEAIEVEGQCDANGSSTTQATIDKSSRTVSLYVDDTVDLTKLRITRLSISNDAEVSIDSTLCNDAEKFPDSGFESLDDLPMSADTRVDFSAPVTFLLQTYQDYEWQVSVEQIIEREINMEGQINAVIDETNRNVIVYVSQDQPLDAISVSTFTLGGPHGKVVPDPTESDTYDFSDPQTFYVSYAWEEASYEWHVYVYQTEDEVSTETETFARATSATVSGHVQSGKTPTVEYKAATATRATDEGWTQVDASAVQVKGTTYTAQLTGLTPGTTYQYRALVDGTAGETQSFSTAAAIELTDGDFDNWHQDGNLWNPWAENGTSFWDTGNRGATTVGNSNSVPTDDTWDGSGKAAELASKYIVLKFAAGNIFTGSYVKTTGTNGVLSFGRSFTSFPTKLRIHYKYTTSTINRVGEDALQHLKGVPDSCHIYIALTDWDQPREIRTRPSERQLFEKNDSHVIAYAELIKGESVSSWTETDLVLQYRYTNRTPKYILVVATASKYGDYFTGGDSSTLWVDDFELIYE